MKMSKVAKMVGVDRRTIYNWVTHKSLESLFSEGARNEGDRELNESDIFVVNTINYLRQNITTDWKEIAERIEDGYQVTELSIASMDVDTGKTPLQQFTRALSIAQERDSALKQLSEAQKELKEIDGRYETKLTELRDRYEVKLDDERKRSRSEMERLLREIAELRYEIGKLESNSPQPKDKDVKRDE
jgi:DNA-binding transcriptional MerR regulator